MSFGIFGALLLPAASCSDDGPAEADPQPTTTEVPTTTESPDPSDEAALEQLAEDWYEFVTEAYRQTSSAEGASQFVIDPYLSQFQSSVAEYESEGRTTEAADESSHEVRSVEVAGDSATVIECIVDADVLLDSAGEIINDAVVAQLVHTAASRTEGGWRFSDRELESEREGETQCAE